MKTLIISVLLLCNFSHVTKKNLSFANDTSEVIFRFKTTELLRFSLIDCPASISARSHVFPKGTVLTIQTVETSNQKIYYQMDGTAEQRYSEAIRLVAKGEHVITVRTLNSNDESVLNAIKFKVVE